MVMPMPDYPGGDPGPMQSPDPTMPQVEPTVIAVSGTPGAPAISPGDPCGIAIGELMKNRFRLVSATPTSSSIIGGNPPEPRDVSSVQYLFVSKPEPRWPLR